MGPSLWEVWRNRAGGHTPSQAASAAQARALFWSPFQNGAGNHNVEVFGKSGSRRVCCQIPIIQMQSPLFGAWSIHRIKSGF